MAATRLRKFGSHTDLELFLRGGIAGGPLGDGSPGSLLFFGLNGKTLIFTTPSTTVTFSDAPGAGLQIAAIIAAIQTTLTATYTVGVTGRRIQISKADGSANVVLGSAGTANAALGFGPAGAAGTKYAPPDGTAPRWISIDTFGPSESVLLLATEE